MYGGGVWGGGGGGAGVVERYTCISFLYDDIPQTVSCVAYVISEFSVLPFQSSCSPVVVVKTGFAVKRQMSLGKPWKCCVKPTTLTGINNRPRPSENTLDLVLSNFTTPISTNVLAPLSRSDHAVLICNFQAVSAGHNPTTSHKLWK